MKNAIKEYWKVVLVEPTKCVAKHPLVTVLYIIVCVLIAWIPLFGIGFVRKLFDKFREKEEETA